MHAKADIYTPFYGTRSMSMGGAHRGLGTSNDTIFVNPAGMAGVRRYSADLQYQVGNDHINRLLGSTVDSKTAALAAGLAYVRTWGNPSDVRPHLNEIRFGVAYAPLPVLSFGVTSQNLNGSFYENGVKQKTNVFNGTLGVMANLGQVLGIGFSYENFIKMKQPTLFPQALGFGAGLRTALLHAGVDLRIFPGAQTNHRRDLGIGGEFFLARLLAIRGGYRLAFRPKDSGTSKQHWMTAGLGLVAGGTGVDVGMEKTLHNRDWRFSANLQFGM